MTTDNLGSFSEVSQRTSLSDRIRTLDGAMTAVAAVLIPLGLLVILLGWYGAAHSPYLFQQVPYLISGGLVGLGFVITGGLVYFGSWIARGAQQQKQSADELAGLLKEIRDELKARPAAAAPAAVVEAPVRSRKAVVASNGANGHAPFVATAKGSMLHRKDCSVVAGRADLRPVPVGGDGLSPCGMCNPFAIDSTVSR